MDKIINKGGNIGQYSVKPIPTIAKVIDEYTTYAKSKNLIWSITDCDITEARNKFREYKSQTGNKISFTAFLVACFSRVVEKYKYPMNTMRKGKKSYIIFDEIDVLINIERKIADGIKKPVNYTIRRAHLKSLQEIHDEIREAQARKDISLTLEKKRNFQLNKLLPRLPKFLRKWLIRHILSDPIQKKKLLGTVGVTAVGMLASYGNGKMVHLTPHTLSLGVGGIGNHPIFIDGELKDREWLGITLAMDHALIDGGPATRFFWDFRHMIEVGCLSKDWCFSSLRK